jgi:hypothetical protein
LRHVLPDQRTVRHAAVGDLGLVVDVRPGDAPERSDAIFQIRLNASDPRLAEFCFCAVVALSVTFRTGSSIRLSNQVSRAVTFFAAAKLTPASPPTSRSGPS